MGFFESERLPFGCELSTKLRKSTLTSVLALLDVCPVKPCFSVWKSNVNSMLTWKGLPPQTEFCFDSVWNDECFQSLVFHAAFYHLNDRLLKQAPLNISLSREAWAHTEALHYALVTEEVVSHRIKQITSHPLVLHS